jgi:predicted dehydrogenase
MSQPVRIGLLGLGRNGTYHLERIRLRSDLQIVAACNCGTEGRPTHPLCQNVLPRIDDLLTQQDLDYILIAAPQGVRGRLAIQSLSAGKNVAVEPPPCVDRAEARTMLAIARRADRTLCILPSRREGLDFRAAQQAILAGSLGTIEAARIVSWAKAVPADSRDLTDDSRSSETAPADVFGFFAFQYVDQLLQLVRRPPTTVFARILSPQKSDPTAAAFLLSVGFRDGGDGLIDVNLHSGAALHTGWMLAGTSGAYCQQRICIAEPSGEICDVPIVPDDVPTIDPYAALLHPPQSDEERFKSARDAVVVMDVLDASRESSRTGEVVGLDEINRHRL